MSVVVDPKVLTIWAPGNGWSPTVTVPLRLRFATLAEKFTVVIPMIIPLVLLLVLKV